MGKNPLSQAIDFPLFLRGIEKLKDFYVVLNTFGLFLVLAHKRRGINMKLQL